jgi:hypothetical protein
MTLKYVYVYGEDDLPGFLELYGLAHIPIDNIILSALRRFDPPVIKSRWSRLRDYDEYHRFQVWVRERFKGSVPLAVEFHLWQASPDTSGDAAI